MAYPPLTVGGSSSRPSRCPWARRGCPSRATSRRRGVSEDLRQDHPNIGGAGADRALLVRGISDWVEPHRQQHHRRAAPRHMAGRPRARAAELRHGGRVHRGSGSTGTVIGSGAPRPPFTRRQATATRSRTRTRTGWRSSLRRRRRSSRRPCPTTRRLHTVLGAAAAEVLNAFFGDRFAFTATNTTLPGVSRRFRGFSAAATENGLSRVYGGIHFVRAVMDGYRQGRTLDG